MTWDVHVLPSSEYHATTAAEIAARWPAEGTVVVTGGRTAAVIYEHLATTGLDAAGSQVFFSDERCVPPDDPESNYRLVDQRLFSKIARPFVHRMAGEDDPEDAAARYQEEIAAPVAAGFDLMLLGLGGDAHVAGVFPDSPLLEEEFKLCAAVDRPDGLRGLTLTPRALSSAKEIMIITTGAEKADALQRALSPDEFPIACPARILADHPNVQVWVDETAAALL